MTVIIGDIHGDINKLFSLVDGLENWIQVGDLGWGMDHTLIPEFPGNGKAIRGNHDDPEVSRNHPSYLGDYGVTDNGIFYMSGAKTPDFDIKRRKLLAARKNSHPMWWEDEQLSYAELKNACSLYEQTKPDLVITHDAPFFLYPALLGAIATLDPERGGEPDSNITANCLSHMFSMHSPKIWYFGHWHVTFAMKINGCWFRCLDINEVVTAGTIDGSPKEYI